MSQPPLVQKEKRFDLNLSEETPQQFMDEITKTYILLKVHQISFL